MPQLSEIIQALESFAPLELQESYDNCGLIVGSFDQSIDAALVCLDCTEAVLEEAIQSNCQLIIAHHPPVFSGLKKVNGKNATERILIQAIRHQIAIYAMHTNLDNVRNGVNAKIGEKLGLSNLQILEPKECQLRKIYTYVPTNHLAAVQSAMFEAGGGAIGKYDECSFMTSGTGTFRPSQEANPFSGQAGIRSEEEEVKIEMIFPQHAENAILKALISVHPYEEVAYEVLSIQNSCQDYGAGMWGKLPEPMEEKVFLEWIKQQLNTSCIRHTQLLGHKVEKVAFCGGSGSFLLPRAIRINADFFITGDFKYHQFFDAEGKIVIADVGHFESEQFTPEIFIDILSKKFTKFAVHLSRVNTNPVHYF